ncbi:transcription initiation factor TFIID component TAF4 [Lenzites betulinus]|nr:transcription initiation factor TFIID component TAF4 [Lenzites betulinus]
MDTTDVATLNDAIGSAGVDLRAEEESLQRSNDNYYSYRPYEDRSRKQPAKPNFDARLIGQTMRTIGTQHKVPKVPEDSVNYLALALRTRLHDLLVSMIAAAQHRTDAQFDRDPSTYEDGRPMWNVVVRSDVAKQLAAIEKVEREEEMRIRRERKERQEAAAAAQTAQLAAAATGSTVDSVGADDEGGPKKKKKKEGPGVTARNMPEDLRKKMSNAVAKQAAGLGTGKYAWMTSASGANGNATPKKGAATPAMQRAGTPATTTAPAQSASGGGSSGWARPYQSSKSNPGQQSSQKDDDGRLAVTLRDAIFVVENEKGHGGGRGAARGWT